jgi:hypothetical protein
VPVNAIAEEAEVLSVSGKTYHWIETTRRYVGRTVQKIGGSVDGYLSKDQETVVNESYVRLRLGYVAEESGHAYPNNDIKLKIDLPKSENRWSLIFETDPNDLDSLQDQQDTKAKERAFSNADGSIGAIKFVLNDWRYWKNDFDVGVKTPLPLESFVRFNMNRQYQITPKWTARLKHSIYFFHQDGLGERSTLTFIRPIDSEWTFLNTTNLRWQHDEEILEYADIVAFQRILTDRDTLLYRIGGFYQDHPKSVLQSYFVDTIYRRRVHEDWLFLEVIPSITRSAENNYDALTSITFRLEVIFD